MGVKHAPRPIGPSHHGRSFNSFGSPIDLTAQASPTPQCCASRIYVENINGAAATAVVVRTADNVQITLNVPFMYVQCYEGAFREISSVTGGTTTVVAFWDDIV
jgi:hypothetical protein